MDETIETKEIDEVIIHICGEIKSKTIPANLLPEMVLALASLLRARAETKKTLLVRSK